MTADLTELRVQRRAPYQQGQRVVWVGRQLEEAGPEGQPIRIAAGDVAIIVTDDWPTDFVVSFDHITLCCDPSDVSPLEDGTH